MKKIMFSFAIFTLLATCVFLTGCQCNVPDSITLIRMDNGMYYINSNPEYLELKMADGGIIFSREKAFTIGVTYTGKDFTWSDDSKDFLLCYDGKTCFDFNRDFIFDFLYENQKSYIRFDGRFIEVNKPDFQAMQATDSNGKIYHWNGSNWVLQP